MTSALGNPLNNNGTLDSNKLMNPSAAAAFSQAMAAMQSLRSMQQARTSLLVNPGHPHSPLLATQAALLQNSGSLLVNGSLAQKMGNGNGQDIDLTLPITSTYLRRMRALGFAAGIDQAYKTSNSIVEVCYLVVYTLFKEYSVVKCLPIGK